MLKNGQTYFENLAVFTPQYFKSMFCHFLTLWKKVLQVKTIVKLRQIWGAAEKGEPYDIYWSRCTKDVFTDPDILRAYLRILPNIWQRLKVDNNLHNQLHITCLIVLWIHFYIPIAACLKTYFQPFNEQCPKMIRHTFKILQQIQSVSDHFGILRIERLWKIFESWNSLKVH